MRVTTRLIFPKEVLSDQPSCILAKPLKKIIYYQKVKKASLKINIFKIFLAFHNHRRLGSG